MDTLGWDIVSCLNLPCVNRQLSSKDSTIPQNFSAAGTDFVQYSVVGVFGVWQFVPGGAAQTARLQVGIVSGTYTFGSGSAAQVANLAGVGVVLDVSLALLPSQDLAGASELRFDLRAVGKAGAEQVPGLVVPIGVVDPAKVLTAEMADSLPALIAGFLVANAAQVRHVFATVDPSAAAGTPWPAPVASIYVINAPNTGPAYLAILGVTTARDTSQLPRAVDGALFAGGHDACFAISAPMFLQHIIQPMLPGAYGHGTSAGTFRFNAASGAIESLQRIPTDGVKKGAITYEPYIDAMSVTLSGGCLVTSVNGGCDLKLNISMSFSITSRTPAFYNGAEGTLGFLPDPDPEEHHSADIPWYHYFLGPIPDVIIAIVVPIIASGIAADLTREMQQFSLAKSPPRTVRWAGLGEMAVATAGVMNGLYLLGDDPANSAAT